MDDLVRLETLAEIMDRLRGPDGCPWDREQTPESLRRYLLEECAEVAEAIDRGDPQALGEELGDLLFQIVFLARIGKERGQFTIRDVVQGIAEKMIRRHPHVFGDARAETADDVVRVWAEVKRREKGPPGEGASRMDGIPAALSPMLKAQQIGDRAAAVGFDWSTPQAVLRQTAAELAELERAVQADDLAAQHAELGDVLFSAVMLARKLKLDPEAALEATNLKFRRRFAWMEREAARAGSALDELDGPSLEALWARAKQAAERAPGT